MIKANWFVTSTMALVLLVAATVRQADGMGMEEFGPAGEHFGRSSAWPSGIEEMLRHSSRVYWQWVNGSERAYFDGDLQAVNELLALYSKTDIAEHTVVIRPGKLTAMSFDRKLTPYVVELDVPGKIAIAVRQKDSSARLRPQVPTLTLALDAKLAERLDELKIPENVTLETSGINVDDALSLAQSVDADVRARQDAIIALGETGDTSTRVLEVLKQAANDDNASIRVASAFALDRISAVKKKPDDAAFLKRLRQFVEKHPQRETTKDSD